MASQKIWCEFESDYFPRGEFSGNDEGLLIHDVDPRHTTAGDPEGGFMSKPGPAGFVDPAPDGELDIDPP